VSEIKEGNFYFLEDGDRIEVMAIRKGYVMARRKGCMPWVCSAIEFPEKLKEMSRPVPGQSAQGKP
jgi:hypothetical protein